MINLYNLDCLPAMREMPDKAYELAIVDPWYQIGLTTADIAPSKEYFQQLFRVSDNQIIWGGNYFNLPHTQAWICWDKVYRFNRKLPVAEFELAWTSLDIKATFLRFTYCGNFYGFDNPKAHYDKPKIIHICQKPVEIYEWLLKNYAKPGVRILDTHGGSGSICIACDILGFDLDWYEIDADYFQAAKERLERHQRQQVLDLK